MTERSLHEDLHAELAALEQLADASEELWALCALLAVRVEEARLARLRGAPAK